MDQPVRFYLFASWLLLVLSLETPVLSGDISCEWTRQTPVAEFPDRYHRVSVKQTLRPAKVALILCDVWDSHHCVNAVRRVHEIAPRIDALASALRDQGATIIHAPSDCMAFYEASPARQRARQTKVAANLPPDLNRWCDQIPAEEASRYPVDQSDGGEDDNLEEHEQWAKTLTDQGRNPKHPWKQQIPTIRIDENLDYITDSGNEVWNILESQGIENVLLCGVHTNMCVLGRPFGLRQLASHGKSVALVRDLTDTMYNPKRWPYVSHFSGTDLVVDHIERYVCATTTSDQLFRGLSSTSSPQYQRPHRFANDKRPHLAILMAEDEYETAITLPAFAAASLHADFRISYVYGDPKDKKSIPGLVAIDEADALLVSARRRPLRPEDLERVRKFAASGKPLIGIRTASHAFSLRTGKPEDGLEQWTDFDEYAWGGHYTNHYANNLLTTVRDQTMQSLFVSKGSLYKVNPLKPGTRPVWFGKVDGQNEEPVAWSFVRRDGGHSFYTSLGHKTDFDQPKFRELLINAIRTACLLEPIPSVQIETTRQAYLSGHGKQR
jgi:nicotinamidase-related amidase